MTRYECVAFMPCDPVATLPAGLGQATFDGYTLLFATEARRKLRAPTRKAALRKSVERQKQIEALMPLGTVLPVLPGMTMDTADLPGFVRANRDLLDQLSAELVGKVQFQVTVHWDRDAARERFATGDIEALAKVLQQEMTHLLATVSDETAELPVASDVLLNTALLIDAAHEGKLDEVVETIDQIWTDGLRIRQVGPAPAVSFASLGFRTFGKRHLRMARWALGLDDGASLEEIARARHKHLKSAQPDQHAALKEAAALLQAHARAAGEIPPPLAFRWQEGRAATQGFWRKVA